MRTRSRSGNERLQGGCARGCAMPLTCDVACGFAHSGAPARIRAGPSREEGDASTGAGPAWELGHPAEDWTDAEQLTRSPASRAAPLDFLYVPPSKRPRVAGSPGSPARAAHRPPRPAQRRCGLSPRSLQAVKCRVRQRTSECARSGQEPLSSAVARSSLPKLARLTSERPRRALLRLVVSRRVEAQLKREGGGGVMYTGRHAKGGGQARGKS